MTDTQQKEQRNSDELPFVAPCRNVAIVAPLTWLRLGFKDTFRAPRVSLTLGAVMALMIMSVVVMAWNFGSAWVMLSLLCGFVFAAPIACVATYAVSALLERQQEVTFLRTFRACFRRYIGTELVFTLVLLVVFLVWARASSMVSVFLPANAESELGDLTAYIGGLGLISLFFLSITFAASVFSLPMIMHRDVDAITAVVTSVNAVLRNKRAMLLWGVLIGLLVVAGILTAGLGLIVFLPAVGHAVWHGYLDTIDAQAFPRHRIGITSVPRQSQEGT